MKLTEYVPTILQLGATAWLAYLARRFQVNFSMRGPRLEAHREAVRRGGQLWWLAEEDPNWNSVMNEMMEWLAQNEVHLEPAAAEALLAIHRWKGLLGMDVPRNSLGESWRDADKARRVLREELLRFRPRTLGQRFRDLRVRAAA